MAPGFRGAPDTPEHRLFLGPETFKKAFRHVVGRVRARGAKNVQFVLHLMNYPDPNDKWNLTECFYPGPEYCDWLGMSLYGSQFPADEEWAPFPPLLDYPYQLLCDLDPNKPIMLCEWGVAELPHLGNKAQWFRDAFRIMQEPRYSRLKAIVYWQERWENSDGGNEGKYSNLKVNSSPETLEAYRAGLANPFYLGEPQFSGRKSK
jgi:beta-mannanase